MISTSDCHILRDLARRVAEIAGLPVMAERRELWKKHNCLQKTRSMILIFPEGSWRELLPEASLKCETEETRRMEGQLRSRIYCHEHFQTDLPVENTWLVPKAINGASHWGIQAKWRPAPHALGARGFDPVIFTPADLKKIRFPEVKHYEKETAWRLEEARDLLDDILDVQLKGIQHVSFHLMALYTSWRGLEQVMLDMAEEPAWLHEAMTLLEEGHRRLMQQYIELNLLDLNNDGTYHSSGGVGYTDELPPSDYNPIHIQPRDMWASAEAQELAQVSPEMHREFSLQYEKRLLAPFGLTGYGCCEDLTLKMDDVLAIPNIRRISVSPFANVEACARKLAGRRAIFSWKPQPAHLVGAFNEDHIRRYLQRAVDVARDHDCALEIILKDTHTCENHPERFDRWSQLAREIVDSGG
ncbi:MAG: hypothetical protein NTX50_23550 [Candidatus Sumerlaeota bacterium]|nr:hypothetical protein [Candidatus Sumerlaeota bacterium]